MDPPRPSTSGKLTDAEKRTDSYAAILSRLRRLSRKLKINPIGCTVILASQRHDLDLGLPVETHVIIAGDDYGFYSVYSEWPDVNPNASRFLKPETAFYIIALPTPATRALLALGYFNQFLPPDTDDDTPF